MMKKKILFAYIALFITIVVIKYIITLLYFANIYDGWIIGDWLINYQAGFVRRGLSGEVLFWLSDITHTNLNYTTIGFQFTIYMLSIGVFFALIKDKDINIWFLIIFSSPATFLCSVLEPYVAGRKEIILFLLFALFILILQRKLWPQYVIVLAFSILLMVSILFHEMIFFYTPYFVFGMYLKSKQDNEPFNFFQKSPLIIGPAIITIIIFLFGRSINVPVMCHAFLEKGMQENICKGILAFPSDSGLKYIFEYVAGKKYYYYGIYLCLGIIPYILFVRYSIKNVEHIKRFLSGFFLLFLFSIPLFIMAIDWGRWLNIHFVLLMLTLVMFLKEYNSKSVNGWFDEFLALPQIIKYNGKFCKGLNKGIYLLVALLFCISWHLPIIDPGVAFSFELLWKTLSRSAMLINLF